VRETEERQDSMLEVDLEKREQNLKKTLPSARSQKTKFRTIEDAD